MPNISEYKETVRNWRSEKYLPSLEGLREPTLEEFFLICEAMVEFDEAFDAYTYKEGEAQPSEEFLGVRIEIYHSVLARDFPDINPRSKYLVAKNNVLADYFNSPNIPLRDEVNISRMRKYFSGEEFIVNPKG